MFRGHVGSETEPIDGMRGTAALILAWYHIWLFSWLRPELKIGDFVLFDVAWIPRTAFRGADMFFFVSAFCLFTPYARHLFAGGTKPKLSHYWDRRIRKIVPSYLVALTVTIALGAYALDGGELFRTILVHVTFLQNMWNDRVGYHNGVLWSLAIECQFYVLFPLVAWCFSRRPFTTWLTMIAISLAYRLAVSGCCLMIEPTYRVLPAYLDTFSFGIGCAYVLHWLRANVDMDRYRLWATLGTVAFFLALVGLFQNCSDHLEATAGRESWQVFGRPIVAAAFFGFALCACSAYRAMRRMIGNPFLIFISTISYNVFLWHHIIAIWLYNHKIPPTVNNVAPHDDPNWGWPYTLLAFPLAIGIPWIITYVYEKPILESRVTTWEFLARIRDRVVPKRIAPQSPHESA